MCVCCCQHGSVDKLQENAMSSLLETGNVEDAARSLRDLKPPKRYAVCSDGWMQRVAVVPTTKCRISAATYWMRLRYWRHAWCSLYLHQSWDASQNCPFPWGILALTYFGPFTSAISQRVPAVCSAHGQPTATGVLLSVDQSLGTVYLWHCIQVTSRRRLSEDSWRRFCLTVLTISYVDSYRDIDSNVTILPSLPT